MAGFPIFIHPKSGGPLQPRMLQYPTLDMTNLLKTITPKKPQEPKAAEESKLPEVDGLQGHSTQFWDNVNFIKGKIATLEAEYGPEAKYMSEYSQLNNALEKVMSPNNINMLKEKKRRTLKYEEAVKGHQEQYHLDEFASSNGTKTYTHRQLVENQNKGVHMDMPLLLGGISTPYGGINTNPMIYNDGMNESPNVFGVSDAETEMDKIWNPADNQYFMSAIPILNVVSKGGMSGMLSGNSKYGDDFARLNKASSQFMHRVGIPQPIPHMTDGEQTIKDKKPMYQDVNGNPVPITSKNLKMSKFRGFESIDLSDPLIAGLMQGYLQVSGGAEEYLGKDLRFREGDLTGQVNENFWNGWFGYIGNFMDSHEKKRQSITEDKYIHYSNKTDRQISGGSKKNAAIDVLSTHTTTKTTAVLDEYGKIKEVLPSTYKELNNFWDDMGLGDVALNPNNSLVEVYTRPDNKEAYRLRDGMSFDKALTVIENSLKEKYDKGEIVPRLGASKEVAIKTATALFREKFKDALDTEMTEKFTGVSNYDTYNFQFSPNIMDSLDDFKGKSVRTAIGDQPVQLFSGSHMTGDSMPANVVILENSGNVKLKMNPFPSNGRIDHNTGRFWYAHASGGDGLNITEKTLDSIPDKFKDRYQFDDELKMYKLKNQYYSEAPQYAPGDGSLLMNYTDDAYNGQMQFAINNQDHPNSQRFVPTGYYMKSTFGVPNTEADFKVFWEKFKTFKVYETQPGLNGEITQAYAEMVDDWSSVASIKTTRFAQGVASDIIQKKNYQNLKANFVSKYGHIGATEETFDQIGKEMTKLLEDGYKGNVKDKTTEIIARRLLGDKAGQFNQTNARAVSVLREDVDAETIRQAIVEGDEQTLSRYLHENAYSNLGFSLSGQDGKYIGFQGMYDATQSLSRSTVFNDIDNPQARAAYWNKRMEYGESLMDTREQDFEIDKSKAASVVDMYKSDKLEKAPKAGWSQSQGPRKKSEYDAYTGLKK